MTSIFFDLLQNSKSMFVDGSSIVMTKAFQLAMLQDYFIWCR